MMIVDAHAHMDMLENIDEVIGKCEKSGVKFIVSNGVDVKSNRKILDLSKKYPMIKAALGVYPEHCLEMINDSPKEFDSELEFIDKMLSEKKAIAVGEVGLEYKKIKDLDDEKKEIMKKCLIKFIELSKKRDVPIILHSRGAELELIELLEQHQAKKVIMHCFCGRKHHVDRIIKNGWTFTIPCNIIKLQQFQDIVQKAPMSQLLTETDAPYLSPEPGTQNDASNIHLTISKIAEIKKMTPEDAANIIYNNYQRLFL